MNEPARQPVSLKPGIYATSAELTEARKRKANATAMGALTGAAVLGGGLGALFISPWWLPLSVAFIGWVGVGLMATAVNHARFGVAPRSAK